ncbi:MAG: hypothetical protein EOO88_31580 [Pedobacter sp.]|nr:MAG: hypothetical protein EOO88_31580 [Pedobacter sp.]
MAKEQVPIKRVTFNTGAPDFIYSVVQWVSLGGYKGFLKDNSISVLDIQQVKNDTMDYDKFHSLPAWEG